MRTTDSGQSALLLLDVIQILNKFKVPYAIIGAFAASFYGMVRASLDADAIMSVESREDIEQLCSAFRKKGLNVDYRQGDSRDPVRALINIRDNFQNSVDLLTGIRGMKEDAFARVKTTKFMGSSIKIIGREDFIAMKIFAGSPKDIQDVLGVLDISFGKINLPLLKKLVTDYGQLYVKKLNKILKSRSS